MMAAAMAAEANPNNKIILLEKNPGLGAKVIISGGGRCNVTTGIFNVKELLKNYPRGAKFLMTALFRFPPQKVMEWFEEHGVPLKIEKDLRIFPVSDNGKDVVGALESALREKEVEILCGTLVTHITKIKEKFQITLKNDQPLESDAVIITTGGSAYHHTGSTGDGYAFAQELGHSITPLGSSLNSLVAKEPWVKDLAGVSFQNTKLTLHSKKSAKNHERIGAFVFTHRGLSGPAVFALSSYAAYETISADEPLNLIIDFFPSDTADNLDKRLSELIQSNPHKSIENLLDIVLPKSLCRILVDVAKTEKTLKAANLSKNDRKKIVNMIKQFPLTLVGRSGGEEFVTAGGVELSEVHTNTMESRLCKGLYFAGEILDIDGFTGGFNLQASWATGALAGSAAAC